jgi:hypothetical protein
VQADPHGGLPVSADLLSLVNLEAFRRDYSSFLRDYSGFVGGGRGRFGLLLLREHPRHDAQLGGRCGWLERQFLFRQLTKKPLYEGLLRDLRFQGLCGSSLGEFGAGDSLGSGENELHTIFLYFFAIFLDSTGQIFPRFRKHFSLSWSGRLCYFRYLKSDKISHQQGRSR